MNRGKAGKRDKDRKEKFGDIPPGFGGVSSFLKRDKGTWRNINEGR